jgi:cytochrome c oxidase cbb3-type subunit 4
MSDLGQLRGLITVVTLLTFLGICWWAYRPSNRGRFEEDARLAFDEHELDGLEGKAVRVRNAEGERA